MFEFTTQVVNRDGFRFIADDINGKWIYKTDNTDEKKVLEANGFKEIKERAEKKESK